MTARKFIASRQTQRTPSPTRTRVYPSSALNVPKSDISDFGWGEGWGEGVPASKRKVGLAKCLRRDRTDAERTLWFQLRDRRLNGWKFKRQVQIDKYIVDFVCAEARPIIEIDGGQHMARSEHDAARTKVLEAMGYLVLRFWNNDVLQNVDGVLENVVDTVNQQAAVPPSP